MSKKQWRKILYEGQDYPDNYVDKTQFLNGLKKNCKDGNRIFKLPFHLCIVHLSVYTQTYGLQEVVLVSGVVTQELSR